MPAVRTDTVLRLHVDSDGMVWVGDDADPAENTYQEVDDFFDGGLAAEYLADAKSVRLLGAACNARLVVRLHERRALDPEFKAVSVRLGAPVIVPSAALRDDPEAVLYHLWQPAAGAWHELVPLDYCTYAMIDGLTDCVGREVPEVVARIAEYHPAWPALTFVTGVDRSAACRLLCDVVDPRWYRHPTRPGRLTRLSAHLGLTPENIAACVGEGRPGRHFNRAANAVRVWYNPRSHRETPGPADFLLATLAAHERLGRGLLRGTERLVAFVAAVWDDAVRPKHPEVAFDPAVFFRSAAVGAAYAAHKATCKRA